MTNKNIENKEVILADVQVVTDFIKKQGFIVIRPQQYKSAFVVMFAIFYVLMSLMAVKAEPYQDCNIYGSCQPVRTFVNNSFFITNGSSSISFNGNDGSIGFLNSSQSLIFDNTLNYSVANKNLQVNFINSTYYGDGNNIQYACQDTFVAYFDPQGKLSCDSGFTNNAGDQLLTQEFIKANQNLITNAISDKSGNIFIYEDAQNSTIIKPRINYAGNRALVLNTTTLLIYGNIGYTSNQNFNGFNLANVGKLTTNLIKSQDDSIDLLTFKDGILSLGDTTGNSNDDGLPVAIQFNYNTGAEEINLTTNTKVMGNLNVTNNITGNIIYGEMYFHNDTLANITLIASSGVFYNVTAFEQKTKGGSNNGFTYIKNSLRADIIGLYKVDYCISFTGGINDKYHFVIAVNDVKQLNTEQHSKTGVANDIISVCGSGLIRLAQNNNINLQVEDETAGNNINVNSVNVNLMRLGT